MPLLAADHLVKRYGGVTALQGVSFELEAGEVHALIGENGAGKSTLIKILAGAVCPDGGSVSVAGKPVEQFDPAVARAAGIAVVYQQPSLFPDLSVAENLALRLEGSHGWRWIRWRERRVRAAALLRQVGAADLSPDTRVSELGMAQQQLIEIAAAIGGNARVIIFDEPTAALGDREAENLFAKIREFRARAIGMIYVSHRLEEIARLADRVTVLRDGACIGTRSMAEVDRAGLVRLMVGRNVESIFPKVEAPIGEIVLETRQLGCRASGVRDVNLTVRAGEIVGLAGLVGAGRSELARTLFGLTPADSGEIRIHGQRVRIESPRDALRHRLAYVPEDRRKHGVISEFTIAQNTTLAALGSIARRGLLDFRKEQTIAQAYAQKLSTKTPSVNLRVAALSGGNQQKVALSRWLHTDPAVLILDEPTQGIDIGAKAEIHRLIGELARSGLAILLISSELPEILGISDRIAVMRQGTIAGVLERSNASPEKILELALTHAQPQAVA